MSKTTSRLDELTPEQRRLIAQRLKSRKAEGADAPAPAVAEGAGGEYPLSFAQHRLWMLEQLQPGGTAYNMPAALRVRTPLDPEHVRRAINEIVRRHGALRTRFEQRGPDAVQVVEPYRPVDVPLDDLAALPEAEREARLARIAHDEANEPFDLAAGPPFRARVVRMGPDDLAILATFHHIVSDGWSLGVFWNELSAFVVSYETGAPPAVRPLTLQFGEHARRQRERLAGSALDEILAWWRQELQGVPHLLEIPADHPRPAVPSGRGLSAVVELDAELLPRVHAFALAEGATPFMVTLAAYQLLLGRYAGVDDLLVGTPAAGRDARDVEPLIGFFANTLAVRGDLTGNPSFRELVGRVRAHTLGAFARQELPFERLVEELSPERSLSWSPLVQTVFLGYAAPMGTEAPAPSPEMPETVDQELGSAKFDLTFAVTLRPGRSTIGAEFAVDLFERETVERMARHYGALLAAALADPDAPAATLPMLAEGERARVTHDFAVGAPVPAPDRSIHAVFATQAEAAPDAVALSWDGGRMTFAELDRASSRLAHHLVARGARPGDGIGLLLERGPRLIVGMLAALKAGGSYVPLDPAYPVERLAFMLEEADARVVITENGSREAADAVAGYSLFPIPYSLQFVDLDAEHAAIGAAPATSPGIDLGPGALAHVIYTSGSTGKPKGVAIPHGAVVGLVREGAFADLGPGSAWLHLAPATFDATTLEVWPALLSGGRVVLYPNLPPDPAGLAASIRAHGVTHLWLTSGLFNLVVDEDIGALAGVRHVMTGGDVVSVPHARRVLEAHPDLRLTNGYGPTENTVFTTRHDLSAADWARASLPVGGPLPGTQAYVLDAALNPAPIGVPGELYAGGEGLAWGYLRRPALTAEKFVPDPFGVPGSRLYRTGDLARWLPEGLLEFAGRADQQVKVRGFRIEIGEIEQALRADPRVGDAVVMARADGPGEKRLVAYVVPRDGQHDGAGPTAAELREALTARLPAYLVPGAFVQLESIPLTPNGKVDRRALPAPQADGDAFVAPRTPTEEVLAGIWAELLGVERVGAEDDFFALGGHSLVATQVISRVRQAFGVELPLRDLFEAPRMGAFADRVDAAVRDSVGMHAPPLVATGGEDLPLSFAQERLWFIDRLEPGNPVYNMPFPLRMRGVLDVASLERALGEVIRRHDSLRTRFAVVDGRPVQRVEPAGDFHLPVDDLAAFSTAEAREAEMARRLHEGSVAPFDLEHGPLVRLHLLRVADDDHVLLVAMHHVVSDGWSMGVFWREVTTLYRAFGAGDESPLPPLPLQYADFAVWQRAWLAGETLDRQVAWWREHLSGAPALLELPTDRPRPATQSHRGDGYGFTIPADVAESVRAFARREGATLFMVLLAAWDVLLARWSGQDDVVVGTPVAGRTRRETEGLIGFFVNTLAIRGDLSDDPSFAVLLDRVREATLGAYAHQDLPFERLVEELQPVRSLSHAPVYQAMLVLQNLPDGPAEGFADELRLEGAGGHTGVAKVDVLLGLMEGPDGSFAAGLEYATDLWDRGTMERLAAHFTNVLRAAVASPDAPVSTLPLMAADERAEAVRMGTATAAHPVATTLHAAFAAQAARTPDAPAVAYGERTLSYAELDARADRLARTLAARGAGPGVLVGLCVERSLETVVGILGILKAGAAYLPLDPAYPDDRLAYMLEDSRAQLVVTAGDAADRLPAGVQRIRLDEDENQSAAADFTPVQAAPDALAYVIYTSGSTGRPKGVQVTHANVLRLFAATDAWFGFGPEDVWTLFHSYAFDFSVWEIWGALLHGGRLVVVPFSVSRDPVQFLGLLERERVTVLNQTPSAFRQLIRADEDAGGGTDLALRTVVFGGEALDPASLRGWVLRRGYARPALVNMYGITETTVHVTWRVIREADVRAGAASPIGIPIPDLSVHLLDRRGQPVPVGIVGEMHVGGAGVARGYLGRPELTAQRFIPDPFGTDPQARLYRSGDLARRLPDGSLEFWGRADDQVKVRGFRIELGEIESVLLEHPAVREAVVLARGAADDRRLVAWTVAPGADAAELRTFLGARLPEYMVPSAFVALDALPLTRNGKVDRRALPEPDAAEGAGAAYVAPRTQTEEVLAGIWAELLGAARVGAADGFFELGGHSLLATRVVSRVREDFGVEVPVRAVFEHPVLESFAAELDRLLRASAGTEAPPIRPADRGQDGSADLPLSFAQERLWIVDRLEPGSPVYHMPFQYLLKGALDADALRRAFGELARRHEVLRTTLPMVGDGPVQRIAPPAPVDVPLYDVSDVAEDERGEAALRVAHEVATRAFDLATGPLWRAALVRLSADEHVLLVNLHHVISDGWSTGVLWNELSALYGAFSAGKASPLPELPIQYGDFAVWQRAWLAGEVLDAQLGYWRRKLAGAPPLLELPTDRPRPAVQTYAGAAESATLQGGEADAVLGLARREGTTLFMVLLAALDIALGRLAGQDDVVVGTPIAGRTRRETEGLIGLFLNSLALRTDLSGEPTFRELLRRVRETTLEAYAHQDLPFERILEEVHPERSLSHTPVFQVMLNLSNFAEGDVALPGLEVHPLGTGGDLASKFDMTLYAGQSAGGAITLHLVYNVALFDAARVREMLAQLVGILRQAAEDVERPVHRMSLLTEEARSVLPDPAAELSPAWRGSVPEIFAAHAARTPDALAAADPAEGWTYAELDAAANAIARGLIADGVRPGDVVAIHGHRGAALVRALIGTLRAGAAFLVLDPAYPAARLAEYVRIARPAGWLPIAEAGEVPAELADALRDTVRSTIPLGARRSEVGSGGVREGGPRDVVAANSFAPFAPETDLSSAPFPEIGPDSLAYLSFTSGTTGKPKAVMGQHGSLTHFTPWLAERFAIGADDRFSLLSGLAHDPLHRDVFTPLQLGAAVVAPDPDEIGTPGYLAQWMRTERITIAHFTPAMGQLLVDVGADSPGETIDSLRRAFFVGDVLTRTDVERLHRLAPNLEVVNYYGSTETQRAVAHFVVPRDTAALARDIIPVGVGIPDVQVVIRNAAGERAGVGEVGEMWMRSPHVALGYLGDPELTAARFVDGAYRTGDLGRYRPDGIAEIAGRADQQLKIRGFRIEPGEIEAVLRAHRSVRDTVVVGRGERDDRRLVAYVVAEGEAPTADAMRAYLKGHVPDYMVPSAWVFLPALPVTPNGKVDRRALPEPETSAPDAHVAPRTPTETVLAEIWAELLKAAPGAHDDFFALGGHSLLATRMVGRVRDALGVELPLRALFEAPTLAGMAARVDGLLRTTADADGPPPIVRRPHGGEAPASFAQERMWFVDRLEGDGPVYHIPSAQHLRGPVDVEAMRRAVQELVRRHETLRTSLPERDGVPVQRIAPPGPVDLPFADLSPLSPEARAAEANRLAERSANDSFDLEAGPLFRVSLVRITDDDHLLLVNLHHAIGDGWSLRVLLEELSALHDAYRRGEPSPLPPLPVQYADYAAWQRAWLRGPVLDAQLGYWRERLAGAPPMLRLPTDRPRPEVQGHRGASVALELTGDDATRVADLARREGATLFMVLLAAFGAVLARWSGQDEVVVGTPIAGRTRPELEGLIGLFLNSLALRTDLSGEPTFTELLRRVRETTLEAYTHQDLPFERVLEELQPERSLAHTPVFQVMLNLLNYGGGQAAEPAAGGDGMTSMGAGAQLASKFDLTLYAAETPSGIGLHAVYDADLFDALRMRALLVQVATVLQQVGEDADRPVSALSLVTEDDAARVAADASPVVVRTRAGAPAGIGELGEVCMRGPDGTLLPMGGAGRYRPDGSVELAAAAPAFAPAPKREAPAAPSTPALPAGEAGRAPRTDTERMVAAVWGEVLGVPGDAIAADTDFFALGGHSLRATQVLSRIRSRAGVRIPVKVFFATPTVAALAAAVDAEAPASTESAGSASAAATSTETASTGSTGTAPIGTASSTSAPVGTASNRTASAGSTAVGSTAVARASSSPEPLPHSRTDALTHSYPPGVYPLSFAQQRLWLLMQLGTSVAYNMSLPMRFTGALDDWALERALDEIVRRHEALRTRIEVRDEEPVQVVQPPRPLRLRAEDVRPEGDESVDDALGRMAAEEAARPFAPEGPFLRARLLRARDEDHVLLWSTHHMVSDGWSLGVFQTELALLYRSFVSGEPSPLPPLAVQYGQHALEQRRALSGTALDELAGWWKDQLAGAPALLELPTDRPRPPEPSGEGSSFWFGFPEGTAERVTKLARSRGATPFMVLMAAFQALLSRWSGQDDVVVGTPIANRTRTELEGLIGFFANTLAIRGDVSGDPPFVSLVERVRDATLGAYEHQDIPFERLVEELNPERSLSHSPVFQVMLVLQNTPGGEAGDPDGLVISGMPREREAAKYDLTLNVMDHGGQLAGLVEYALDLFDAATMERLVTAFVVLLDAALDGPQTTVSALPLMEDEARAALLEASAGPSAPLPDLPLHGMFEAQAARTPDATALRFGTERLTYSELDARANRLAHLLRARGIGPDQPVAVLMERSVEMVVALYGILKAGAAYVPVDPEYPGDRVAYMLEDSAAALVLTQERWMDSLGGSGDAADAIALDLPGVLDAFPADRVDDAHAAGTERLAYVIYTSGSTGRPKGAMNAHRGVVNRIAWMQDAFGLTAEDAVLQKTPFSFDVSVWEFFWPLAVGARLVIAPPGAHRDPVVLNGLIQREGITTLHFVPSMLRAWLDGADASDCTSLRLVMSSGEALPADLVTRFFHALPSGQLHNLYGPTEAAVDVTHWPCTPEVRGSVPIGRPIANTRMYVLDARGEPAPVGVPGELWIAGIQVGRGYWRRAGLTAERFVPDPFAPDAGARMYRTGDRARWLADGNLEYLGRTDFQVKVRGFRIEPGEIEAELAALPGVRQAVVDARTGPGGARLVAWIAAEGAQPAPAELRAGLLRSLPDHMVPSVFVPVDSMPLTPSGKVDRRALPEPEGTVAQGGGYVPPRSPTEQLLAQAWSELLGVERVGASDTFFALGGHSLLATRMVSRVREMFGVELPLRTVFEVPVLRDLAARIDRTGRDGDDPFAPPALVPMAPENDAPLSFAQERLWFIERLAPAAYNMSPSVRLAGEIDAAALERALAEVVRRHEPLRTAFVEVDEVPVQHVLPAEVFALETEDLSGAADEDAREAEVVRQATEFSSAPFDLAAGPLFRARLIRIAPDDHVLLMSMHHAASDGWSLGILFRELFTLYDAFRAGEPSPLPPLPVRYADFAVWQRTWLRDEALERQLAYWRERLAGAPPVIRLPTDRPRPDVQSARGGSYGFAVPADVAESVRALARREGVTPFMALLAAWNVLLARASGDADVVVGTPIAGRTRAETEGLIGLFVNTLALRTDLADDPDYRALLVRVRETTLGAYAHQDLPFEKLVEELRPERSLGHSPVFQVMFVFQNTPDGAAEAPSGLGLSAVAKEGSQAKVDLTLTMAEGPDGALYAGLGYAAELFDAESMERMAGQLVTLLRGLVADPDAPVSALPLLADEERAEVDTWGRAADADLPLPVRVLDAHGAPVPAGIPGELCVADMDRSGGDGAAYVDDPFAPGVRLRRTGERVRWRGDGTLERLGSVDAGATVRERTAPPVDAEEGYVAPRTATEATVAAVWAELLGRERVGVNDGFFDLGGHSLLGTRVVSRLRDRLGVEVPLAALFAAPRLEDFAARVDEAALGGAGVRLPAIRRTEGDTAPASFAQERLWFIDRLEPGSALYNMSPSLRMQGPLDPRAVAHALREIVRRHEPLRTSLPLVDGMPVQRIGPAELDVPLEDVSQLADSERDGEVARRTAEWARMPFDLENGPLFRASLLRIAPEDHVLLLAMHHAVSDGWSNGILYREFFALYEAFAAGRPSPLPPLPVRYADYAAWQREWLSGKELERQVAFWREALAGAPAVLELPGDRPRAPDMARRGAVHAFTVPADVANSVRALARRKGATLFMALLAAFDAVLARWSGQDDVVVGTPVAGRTRRETEGLIGLFVNTLALRTDLSGNPPFLALLERVRAATLGAFAHQDLPFEKLVEELQPERSLGRNPVFQVMFNLGNAGEGAGAAPAGLGLALAGGKDAPDAKVDLTLTVNEHADGTLHGFMDYPAELFEAATVERMAAGLLVLLRAAAARPETPVADLPLFEADERRTLLEASAGPSVPVADVPLHAAFEAQAAYTPDATALVFGTERVTYSELDARANRLAHLLRARGIGPDQPVAVLMERSVEMVVALYGILKAGAAYVPVDPEYPADRVAYMLKDSAAALVLTQERLLDGLDDSADAIALDRPGVLDGFSSDRPDDAEAAGTERLAYVIYTSGSTGRPKGAMNAHRGVVNRIAWMQDAFGLTAGDAVLQKTPFSFDVSVWEFFWPLAVGARLVIAPPGVHRDPVALNELIQREGITTLHFVPSMLRAWLDGADASACTGLRYVMSSGEALTADLVNRFFDALPSGQLHNLYGPTEAAVDVTHWPCTPEVRGSVPIGRPIANTRMYVLDARGEPVPVGVPGELWIAGIQVGRGYWRRSGLTAERFVPDPFAPDAGARMYRTGDRARWLADGTLEYLGRTDFQVKVRGVRVEPGEVEAALAALPGVRQAVVDVRAGAAGEQLVAWIAAEPGASATAGELHDALLRTLPAALVPSVFVPVDSLPLTPSGKVDRRALPAPEHAGGDGYVVPRDVTELEVARIWSEALGVPRLGASDDFFRLGGHSLLALRMMTRIRERFGRDLPLASLFKHSTVAAFATALRREGVEDDGRLLVALTPGGTQPPLIFFPPAGGTVTHYADLARLLGPDQPFLALHAPGVEGGEAPLGTMDAMVDRYLDEIRRAQPHGPYRLGGWSAGGLTAFETARRLRAVGEEVALLAIIDAPAPDDDRDPSTPDRVQLFRNFARATVTGDEALLDALVDELRALPEEERLAGLSRWIARHGGQVMDHELERVGRVLAVFEATARALRDYVDPPAIDVPVALFVAAEGKPEDGAGPEDRPARWRPFVSGEMSVHVLPGVHAQLVLEPTVHELADALREVLAARRAR
jgi:amino acid adenylation domain-containing protein